MKYSPQLAAYRIELDTAPGSLRTYSCFIVRQVVTGQSNMHTAFFPVGQFQVHKPVNFSGSTMLLKAIYGSRVTGLV
jgi:hypothetical protein